MIGLFLQFLKHPYFMFLFEYSVEGTCKYSNTTT
jgi:hypothetical protein